MPTVAFNICCPRDCVSRHNGVTSGAPLKPLRALSTCISVGKRRHVEYTRGAHRIGSHLRKMSDHTALMYFYMTYFLGSKRENVCPNLPPVQQTHARSNQSFGSRTLQMSNVQNFWCIFHVSDFTSLLFTY